jgi:hypothetical protein
MRMNLGARQYEQRTTMERWEDIYFILNAEPVFFGVQLKETRNFDDAGSVQPLHDGVDVLVFTSTLLVGHTFNGFQEFGRVNVVQRVYASGESVALQFGI